jgi:hypothetical protein
MNRQATMDRIAKLEIKVAVMEYQAGMGSKLKGLFLKLVVQPLSKYRRHLDILKMPLDDLMDDVVEVLAPKITEKMQEDEVDADMTEFEEGAILRAREKSLASDGGYYPPPNPPKGQTPEYYKGYEWAEYNRLPIPNSVKKTVIENAAKKHDKKVIERALLKAVNVINPVEILKHIFHIIKSKGWDPFAEDVWYKKWTKRFFMVVMWAIAMAIVEALEHYALPKFLVWVTGDPMWWGTASIPLLEIVLPIVLAFFKKADVEDPGHLDWYEENYGEIENVLDDNVFEDDDDDDDQKVASYRPRGRRASYGRGLAFDYNY